MKMVLEDINLSSADLRDIDLTSAKVIINRFFIQEPQYQNLLI